MGSRGIRFFFCPTSAQYGPIRFKQLEVNAQIIRFPSGLETEFAGQALYLLRVYGLEKSEQAMLKEVPLENSPDVQQIEQDSAHKESFLEWVNEHILDIDNGTYLIPEEFLATEALILLYIGDQSTCQQTF